MICVSVLYPQASGKTFDHAYYAQSHMPMVMDRLKSFGLNRYEIDEGLAGGAPGSSAPFACVGRLYLNSAEEFQKAMTAHGAEILGDISNYTNIEPQIQVSRMTTS